MTKPMPRPTSVTKPFWDACRRHELRYQRCCNCAHVQFIPRPVCVACHGRQFTWELSAGRGTIHSFTVVYRAPSAPFKGDVPYIIALVDIDEGFRMMCNLHTDSPDAVHIGQAVRIVYSDFDDITLPNAEVMA